MGRLEQRFHQNTIAVVYDFDGTPTRSTAGNRRGISWCRKLLAAGRVDLFAAADYRSRKRLDRRFKLLLDMVIARIVYEKEAFGNRREV